ncbi:hypothetical protein ASG93_22385 [Paenibacillus sp. Soil787]|nr:hypothetical protein ASG93_22385 [Paenibacillus sp. Soil787]
MKQVARMVFEHLSQVSAIVSEQLAERIELQILGVMAFNDVNGRFAAERAQVLRQPTHPVPARLQ